MIRQPYGTGGAGKNEPFINKEWDRTTKVASKPPYVDPRVEKRQRMDAENAAYLGQHAPHRLASILAEEVRRIDGYLHILENVKKSMQEVPVVRKEKRNQTSRATTSANEGESVVSCLSIPASTITSTASLRGTCSPQKAKETPFKG